MEIYELVKVGKKRQGIESDRAFALKNGLTEQNISDWKAGRSKPSALNYLRTAKAAGMDINEALAYLEEIEAKRHKQAGFATVGSMATVTGMSLAVVTASPGIALLTGIGGTLHCILCKIDVIDFEEAANEDMTPRLAATY